MFLSNNAIRRSVLSNIRRLLPGACMLFATYTMAQSPGGIGTSLTTWFKANTTNTTNLTLNSNRVVQWTSEVNNFSVAQAMTSQQPILVNSPNVNNNFNFNPSLQFDGSAYRSLNNTGTTPDLLGTNGTVFLVINTYNYAANSSTCFAYYASSLYRYQVKAHFRIQTGNNGTGYTADFNPQFPSDYGDAAGRILVSRSTGTDFYSKRNGDVFPINNTAAPYNPSVAAGLCIGANNNGGGSEYSNSAIAEVITYNTTLSNTDINKIESYLAVKYGATLSQSATYNNNYTSSNGTITWNRNANSGYATNITGIGRDDGSGLLQKQSRSVNTNGLVYVYNGNTKGVFPAMNAGNSSAFVADNSFLLFGDNAAITALTACSNSGKLPRMVRTWKVQKTGTIDTVTLSVNTTSVPAQVKNILVSADPTFPPGATTMYPVSTAAGMFYAAVALHNNDYFTFAADSLQVSFTEVQPDCTNPNGGSITAVVSGGLTPQTYSWNTTPTQTTTTAGNLPAGGYTFTVTNNGGCTATYSPDSLKMPTAVVLAPTTSQDSICTGQSTILNANASGAGSSTSLTWTPGNQSGTTVTVSPTVTTMYVVTAQDGSCVVKDSVQVAVKPVVTASFTTIPAAVCTNRTDTITFTGKASAGATYTWNFDGATILQGSGAGPYTIQYPTIGTKTIQLQLVDDGCAATGSSQVTVVESPVASFTATPGTNTPVQLSFANFQFTNTSQNATGYVWTFGDGDTSQLTSPGHSYNLPGNYTVTLYAYNSLGCVDTAYMNPFVVVPDPELVIPNAFSPNNDGINDTWVIKGLNAYPDAKVDIYNRWGQRVFGSKGYPTPWDGRYNGTVLPVGTFYYVVIANGITYSGWLMLFR